MNRTVAFPVIESVKQCKTRMVEMSTHILPQVENILRLRTQRNSTLLNNEQSNLQFSVNVAKEAQMSDRMHACNSVKYCSNTINSNYTNGVSFTLRVGSSIAIPLTVIGTQSCSAKPHVHITRKVFSLASMSVEDVEEETLFVHSPGLAGAFPVEMSELYTCRGVIDYMPYSHCNADDSQHHNHTTTESENSDSPEARQLGMLCVASALSRSSLQARWHCLGEIDHISVHNNNLDAIYRTAVRRHVAVRGMSSLIACGSRIFSPHLQLDFPYHCGGLHAEKHYLDITPEATTIFGAEMVHGAKTLNRFGVAVCVGVGVPRSQEEEIIKTKNKKINKATRQAHSNSVLHSSSSFSHLPSCEDEEKLPSMYWHPSGALAACTSPLLHGLRLLNVGKMELTYNGPTRECPLLVEEDVRRYMNIDHNYTNTCHEPNDNDCQRRNQNNDLENNENENELDQSEWLCYGLFGTHIHQVCEFNSVNNKYKENFNNSQNNNDNNNNNRLRVAGVKYNTMYNEFDLYVRDEKSNLLLLADILEYHLQEQPLQ